MERITKMKTSMLFPVVFLTLAPLALAEESADQILARYFAAAGVATQRSEFQNRVSEGWLETSSGRAGVTIRQKAPNRVLLELRLPRGTIRRGFDGAQGWEDSTISGYRPMSPQAQSAFSEEYALASSSLSHIVERFPKRERLSGSQLKMTQRDGTAETWAFDPATHLLVRIEKELDGGPQGIVPVTVVLEDYRRVDELLLAHTIRTQTKTAESILRLDTIRHDVPLQDSLFAARIQP